MGVGVGEKVPMETSHNSSHLRQFCAALGLEGVGVRGSGEPYPAALGSRPVAGVCAVGTC